MLIILGIALFPLGLIAIFASRESAHVNHLRHDAEVRAMATAGAVAILDGIRRPTFRLRRALDDLVITETGEPIDPIRCEQLLHDTMAGLADVSAAAILGPGNRPLCRSSKYSGLPVSFPSDRDGFEVRLAGRAQLVRTNVAASKGHYFAVAEFSARDIARKVRSDGAAGVGISLQQGGQSIILMPEQGNGPLEQIIQTAVPAASGQFSLKMQMPVAPISALEILMILLPILMWVSGAIIGWIVVERLLLHPLDQMQRAIAAFNNGKGPLTIPRLTTPAHEISALGASFARATDALIQHERELAEALGQQKRLTREVHHRIKNNLQVVSSLISLHARGAETPEMTRAYASIQRRIDALSVVYRNYYAELEQSDGISLRTLIGEIASNLRANPNAAERSPPLTLDLMTASASQDGAVPIAFLVTEIVELAMHCNPSAPIEISLKPVTGTNGKAVLSIASPCLSRPGCLGGETGLRFQRIAEGLARQLRSSIIWTSDQGRYAIEIPIMAPETAPGISAPI